MVDEVVTAYHESGHVVLAEHLGAHVLTVTIEPQLDDGPRRHGETTIAWSKNQINADEQALMQARVALAGPAAEMIYCDQQFEAEVIQEWWADWLVAANSIRQIRGSIPDQILLSILGKLTQDLIQWMSADEVWDRIARVADELEAHQTLDSDQLDELRELGFLGR